MCTDQIVWTLIAKELILPFLKEGLRRTNTRIINMWTPHGIESHSVLEAIATVLAQDTGIEEVEIVKMDQVDSLSSVKTGPTKRTLLLAHGMDRFIGSELFYTVEIQLSELLAADRIFLVLATNTPVIPWGTNELWQQTINVQLGPLDPEKVKQIAQNCGLTGEDAWSKTLGYVPSLQEWIENPGQSDAAIAAHAFTSAVGDCTMATQELAQVASLLPFFNVAALRYAKGSVDDNDEEYDLDLRGINELMANGIITWNMDSGWYCFTDGALRRLFVRKFVDERQEEVAAIRKRALRYFVDEAMRPAYLQYCFVSAVYHLATSIPDTQSKEVGQICLRWVEHSLPSWSDADWYAVLRAWQTGGDDWHVMDELESQLGTKFYDQITKSIGKALETAQ